MKYGFRCGYNEWRDPIKPTQCVDKDHGLVTGSKGRIIDITMVDYNDECIYCPVVKFLNGVTRPITPIATHQTNMPKNMKASHQFVPFALTYPFQLCYCATVHGSLGKTYSDFIKLFANDMFEVFQFYVRLGRSLYFFTRLRIVSLKKPNFKQWDGKKSNSFSTKT